jgi:hypothetical protein
MNKMNKYTILFLAIYGLGFGTLCQGAAPGARNGLWIAAEASSNDDSLRLSLVLRDIEGHENEKELAIIVQNNGKQKERIFVPGLVAFLDLEPEGGWPHGAKEPAFVLRKAQTAVKKDSKVRDYVDLDIGDLYGISSKVHLFRTGEYKVRGIYFQDRDAKFQRVKVETKSFTYRAQAGKAK